MSATSLWSKALVLAGAASALILMAAVWPQQPAPAELLAVRFVGYTNGSGMTRPHALFEVTSFDRDPGWFDHRAEVKTGGNWSNYLMMWSSLEELRPGQTRRLEIMVPEFGSAWRLRVAYHRPVTAWEKRRLACAEFLRKRQVAWAARLVNPRKRGGEIATAAVKS